MYTNAREILTFVTPHSYNENTAGIPSMTLVWQFDYRYNLIVFKNIYAVNVLCKYRQYIGLIKYT